MSAIANQPAGGRRRRRLHSDEFKACAVTACMQPGVSMASVAMSHGINANLLRRWVKAAEMRAEMRAEAASPCEPKLPTPKAHAAATFVPLALPAPKVASEVRVELRRGATTILVTWPAEAAAECAAWMRELLR